MDLGIPPWQRGNAYSDRQAGIHGTRYHRGRTNLSHTEQHRVRDCSMWDNKVRLAPAGPGMIISGYPESKHAEWYPSLFDRGSREWKAAWGGNAGGNVEEGKSDRECDIEGQHLLHWMMALGCIAVLCAAARGLHKRYTQRQKMGANHGAQCETNGDQLGGEEGNVRWWNERCGGDHHSTFTGNDSYAKSGSSGSVIGILSTNKNQTNKKAEITAERAKVAAVRHMQMQRRDKNYKNK